MSVYPLLSAGTAIEIGNDVSQKSLSPRIVLNSYQLLTSVQSLPVFYKLPAMRNPHRSIRNADALSAWTGRHSHLYFTFLYFMSKFSGVLIGEI
jgi:hypothetical protein